MIVDVAAGREGGASGVYEREGIERLIGDDTGWRPSAVCIVISSHIKTIGDDRIVPRGQL